MIKIQCKVCGKEVHGSGSCGCPNMATIRNDRVSATDLSKIIMIEAPAKQNNKYLSNSDLLWQEERKQRKVRKLDFEIR